MSLFAQGPPIGLSVISDEQPERTTGTVGLQQVQPEG